MTATDKIIQRYLGAVETYSRRTGRNCGGDSRLAGASNDARIMEAHGEMKAYRAALADLGVTEDMIHAAAMERQ